MYHLNEYKIDHNNCIYRIIAGHGPFNFMMVIADDWASG